MGAGEREGCMMWKRLTMHPPAACLRTSYMSLGLVMLMKSNQHTLITANSPFYVSKGLSFFFFFPLSTTSTTSSIIRPQMVFFPKRPLLFQLRMILLKPCLTNSMWKLGQKGFTSRFTYGIEQSQSVALPCLSFFTQ